MWTKLHFNVFAQILFVNSVFKVTAILSRFQFVESICSVDCDCWWILVLYHCESSTIPLSPSVCYSPSPSLFVSICCLTSKLCPSTRSVTTTLFYPTLLLCSVAWLVNDQRNDLATAGPSFYKYFLTENWTYRNYYIHHICVVLMMLQ